MTINDETARTGVTLVPKRGRSVDPITIVHVFGGGSVRVKDTSIFLTAAQDGKAFGWEATLCMTVRSLRKDYKLVGGEAPANNDEAVSLARKALA